ncbi:MAG: 16S rRNA (uracil(1498)-N(3))-methyltransferase [Schleiferiaceae bacterium]|nr:16S rRNA (uracil(1498)-N(3))-methyltransferase [Schleiferiaceae bacterium]
MQLFYSENITEDWAHFTREETKHFAKVLRLAHGQTILIADGKGSHYSAILDLTCQPAKAKIIEVFDQVEQRKKLIHIAVAPTKNIDRMEWLTEKATEIGFASLQPLWCERSERKQLKEDRLQRIALAAMKQSGRAFLPDIKPAMRFSEFILQERTGGKFIAHCLPDGNKIDLMHSSVKSLQEVTLLIGPEGDFSASEIAQALAAHFAPVSLGPHRLRTETAALVGCMQLQ